MSKNPLIILIDDDPTLLQMYEKKLILSDFKVLTACDGVEGIKVLSRNIPDLILTDLVMPKTDGFEVLRQIKSNKKLKGIPTVALTNLSSESDKKEVFELGAIDYIVKSNYTPSQVVERVRHHLGINGE